MKCLWQDQTRDFESVTAELTEFSILQLFTLQRCKILHWAGGKFLVGEGSNYTAKIVYLMHTIVKWALRSRELRRS